MESRVDTASRFIEVDINILRALAPFPRPRPQDITRPAPHAAAPLEPQAQPQFFRTRFRIRPVCPSVRPPR
jgi:hypothetical protein